MLRPKDCLQFASLACVLRWCYLALILPVAAPDSYHIPHFKWGQAKDKLFITVSVRGLAKDSVDVRFADEQLTIELRDNAGQLYRLELALAQDVLGSSGHWEHLPRPERWGDAILATVTKRFPGRWDELALDSKVYKGMMERDWVREDPNLEPPEEDPFFDEHKRNIKILTLKDLEDARRQHPVVALIVRHSGCAQCKLADDNFAKVARKVAKKRAKGNTTWNRLMLAVVDARVERPFARRLNASCQGSCQYFVFANGGERALVFKARYVEEPMLKEFYRLAQPQFGSIASAAEVPKSDKRNICIIPVDASASVTEVAHSLRLHIDIVVAANAHVFHELGGGANTLALLQPAGQESAVAFSGSSADFGQWLRKRSMPPMARVSQLEDEEPYEMLGMPVAKLFLTGGPADEAASTAVNHLFDSVLSGRFSGVMIRNGTQKAYEASQHGLPPNQFPALALANSSAYNASKYAFIVPGDRGDPDIITGFWKAAAAKDSNNFKALVTFAKAMMAGDLEPSTMSAEVIAESPILGKVWHLVGSQCRRAVEDSEYDLLIEGVDEWIRDPETRLPQTEALAEALKQHSVAVARIDLGKNECPRDLIGQFGAGYSGYFFAPPHSKARGLQSQVRRLKKLEPSLEKIIKFVTTNAAAKIDGAELEKEVQSILGRTKRNILYTSAIGGAGLLFVAVARLRSRVR